MCVGVVFNKMMMEKVNMMYSKWAVMEKGGWEQEKERERISD